MILTEGVQCASAFNISDQITIALQCYVLLHLELLEHQGSACSGLKSCPLGGFEHAEPTCTDFLQLCLQITRPKYKNNSHSEQDKTICLINHQIFQLITFIYIA